MTEKAFSLSLRSITAHHNAHCNFVYLLPVTNCIFHCLQCLLSYTSSRKRRCTFVHSLNSCKECISKGARCSLSDQGGTISDNSRSRRTLLPHQQSTSVSPGLHRGFSSSSLSIYEAPDHDLCLELIALYFDIIHDKQHVLFHPPTFVAQYHAGQAPEFLVWGMAALVSRSVDADSITAYIFY